jgi:hypothetical protein
VVGRTPGALRLGGLVGVLESMHAGVMDPCTVPEDLSRRVGSNRDVGSRVGSGMINVFIVGLTSIKETVLYF